MNKYDDITSFILSESNIKQDYEFLTNFISTFLYKNMNREKIEDYYSKIPSILDKIYGITAKTNQFKQQQTYTSIVDLLSNEKTTFEDFDALLHLVLPGMENTKWNYKNIFHSVNSPPDYVPGYKFNASLISESIRSLINQKKQDYILSLSIFEVLSKNVNNQRACLETAGILFNIFEYFLVFLLIVIKDYPHNFKHKINLPKSNKNFEDFIKNYSPKKSLSEKTKENLYAIDSTKSLVYNFYLIFFKNMLNYFSQSKFINDQYKLKLLVSAVELVWLSDYFMIPLSSYISKSPLDMYLFFFRSNTNQTNYSGYYPSTRIVTPFIPNIILLDCLHNLILTLQTGNKLFKENSQSKSYILEEDEVLIFRIQKPLFYFFKTSFLKFFEESTTTEVNLNDIAKIWFTYITPWMQIVQKVTTDPGNNYSNSNNNLYSYSKNNRNKLNTIEDVIQEFIYKNLLFYTELFNDYIFAFSSLNVLNKNELSLLNKVLDLYKIKDGEIINSYVNLKILEDLSQGKLYNYSSFTEVDNHIKYIGSLKRNIFPFNHNENKKYAKSIVNNISNWLFKLQNRDGLMNDEIVNFTSTLRESQIILKSLYNVQDELEQFEQSNQKNFISDSNNIYCRKDYDAVLHINPWCRKITTEENYLLFHLFKFICYWVDSFKGIPIRYDRKGNKEPPITNLRFLSNYYNLGSAVIFILIIYLLIKVIYNLVFR